MLRPFPVKIFGLPVQCAANARTKSVKSRHILQIAGCPGNTTREGRRHDPRFAAPLPAADQALRAEGDAEAPTRPNVFRSPRLRQPLFLKPSEVVLSGINVASAPKRRPGGQLRS